MKRYTSDELRGKLLSLKDDKYAAFSQKLLPGTEGIIGVKLNDIRKIAKEIAKGDYEYYFQNTCNDMQYFEEIMLKGMVIGELKVKEDELFELISEFVPIIDNWSVNDSFCSGLKRIRKCLPAAWNFLSDYISSTDEFKLRFGIVMLKDYFLTEEFAEPAIYIVSQLNHEGYYARMAMAWFMATAYAKYPEMTLNYLQKSNFDTWTYNRSLQKMIESYKISDEDKELIRKLKR